jgi:hypothetical protein
MKALLDVHRVFGLLYPSGATTHGGLQAYSYHYCRQASAPIEMDSSGPFAWSWRSVYEIHLYF